MTDQPGQPGPEERLPAPRPAAPPAPVERFTSPPGTRKFELTPDRAAQIVRQSSNARWVSFLAVVIVVLFVALYWFYELGGPLGVTTSRLETEREAQQVLSVERGYNIYEANCARCHGVNGEGGIGPTLNRQDKLFQHLNESYLHNILTVGGRYACGNADSQMPIWSNEGNPPGPLNYIQIEELIAFIRAENTQTYTKRDPELMEPRIDPVTGEVETFTGWVDPNYEPEPNATPFPACWADEFAEDHRRRPARVSRRHRQHPASAPRRVSRSGSAAPSGAPGRRPSRSSRPASSSRRPTSWRRPTWTSRSTSTTRTPTCRTTSTSVTPTTRSSRTASPSPAPPCARSRSVRWRRARTPSSARSIRT